MNPIDPPKIYRVSVNEYQLNEKAPHLKHLFIKTDDTTNHLSKNKMIAEFTELRLAADLYWKLNKQNIIVFRNWIN